MSIKIMSAIFEGDLPPTKRLIMIALADHANDEGVCYPSISRLCDRTGLGERSVQKNIRELVADGYIKRDLNGAKNGANLYRLTPAPDAPPHEMHPAQDAPHPRTRCTPTPARDAPEPSGNHQEPSFSLGERDPFDDFNEIANSVGWPIVQAKSKPRQRHLSARVKECGGYENWLDAMKRAAASDFLSGRATGTTPATFDWLHTKSNFTKLMEGNYDNRAHNRTARADTRTDKIAFAARSARSPSADCF